MGTHFPEFVYLDDPMANPDHDRDARTDPRDPAEVLTVRSPVRARKRHLAVVPGSVSDRFVAPPASERFNRAPAELLENARYHEHGFRWTAAAIGSLVTQSIVEIARWHVPARHLGIIDHIDTHLGLTLEIGADPPAFLDLAIDLPWQPWLHEVLGLTLRWWLRVEAQREIEEVAAVALNTVNELPGSPLPELATWTDQRFGYNYHGKRPLRILIPERTTVRLFVGADDRPRPPPGGGDVLAKVAGGLSSLYVSEDRIRSSGLLEALNLKIPSPAAPESGEEIDLEMIAMETAAAAAAEQQAGFNVAGRIIGTIQFYRDNPAALEAARRGL